MTLAELIAEVYIATNRPDLVNETASAVKRSTLKMHQSDFYPKDIYETAIEWVTPAYVQSLEYGTIIPRWRAFKFLRKFDAATNEAGAFFNLILPEQVLDNYGVQKEDICYLAGSMLEIKSSTQDSHMLVGCYRHPDITTSGYNSWIANDHPYLIIADAARSICNQIGWAEQETKMRAEVAELFPALKMEVSAGGI